MLVTKTAVAHLGVDAGPLWECFGVCHWDAGCGSFWICGLLGGASIDWICPDSYKGKRIGIWALHCAPWAVPEQVLHFGEELRNSRTLHCGDNLFFFTSPLSRFNFVSDYWEICSLKKLNKGIWKLLLFLYNRRHLLALPVGNIAVLSWLWGFRSSAAAGTQSSAPGRQTQPRPRIRDQ